MNKRLLLAGLCDRTGATDLALALRKRTSLLRALNLHTAGEKPGESPYLELDTLLCTKDPLVTRRTGRG